MAWVRIDDGAMTHPKILALSDSAFRLWIKGLCYCQTHLTDGLIPRDALRTMRPKRQDVDALTTAIEASYAPLWEVIDGFGFKVHNYLDYNDSREKARKRQALTKARKEKWNADRNAVQNASVERVPNASVSRPPNPTQPNPTQPIKDLRAADGGSNRIVFKGQRFVVFEWMLDKLIRALGPNVEKFDLHSWFFDLDARAAKSDQVIPQRDGGEWLQAQTLAEAKRRGLPIATSSSRPESSGRVIPGVEETKAYLAELRGGR